MDNRSTGAAPHPLFLPHRILSSARLPCSPFLNVFLFFLQRHDDRHFRSIALRAVFPAPSPGRPPLPPSRVLVSVREPGAYLPPPRNGEKKIGSTVTRLDSGAVPLLSLSFPFASLFLPSAAHVARRMQLQYNYPSFSARLPLFLSFCCLFSRFQECDFYFAKLPALRRNRIRREKERKNKRKRETEEKGRNRKWGITSGECLFNRFPFQSIR